MAYAASLSNGLTVLSQTLLIGGLALLPAFISQYAFLDEVSDRLNSRRSAFKEEIFDFIVVGAGSSGSVVANRLSENYKVLLLEGDPFPLMAIPAMASLFPNNPSYDWAYHSVPQKKSCLSLKNQESLWPKGKALGGTSTLNFMAYIRGHPLDYNNWASITGDDSWSYENMLPYFKKSEHYTPFGKMEINETIHGIGGEVHVEEPNYKPITPYFLAAAQELGYPIVDVNAPFDEGFGILPMTAKNGRRWNAYNAFLEGINNRRMGNRLTIYKYATVTRVLFKGSNHTAYGVEYARHGEIHVAKANKEIILSAGTVGSPKILMLSGIGPKKHLRSLGIPTRVNRPVGENLQDHVIAFVGPFTTQKKLTFVVGRDTEVEPLLTYVRSGAGPLSSTGIEATGLLLSNHAKEKRRRSNATDGIWPDLQLILIATSLHRDGPKVVSGLFNLEEAVGEAYYRPVAGRDSFHVMALATRPKSRGRVQLASKDFRVPPRIDPNYLDHPYDATIILEGVEKALELVEKTMAFKRIGAALSPTPFPPCAHEEYRSRAYWRCYVEQYTLSVYHHSSTCPMGQLKNPNAVVDSTLKVIGTQHLRVVDASIQPLIISTNTQAVCMAIGERGADFIKNTWRKQATMSEKN